MSRQKRAAALVLVALSAAFGVGVYAGLSGYAGDTAAAQGSVTISVGPSTAPADVDLSQFWKVWNVLNNSFVETHASSTPPTDQEKVYGAISGLVDSYGDPYTVFLPPQDAQIFNDDVNGSFGGVGMQMGTNDKGQVTIVSPLKDSPAAAAGILSGDLITSIDGTSTADMNVDEAVKLIRGPVGTTVVLGVLHQGDTKPVTISIVRDTINIPTIDTKNEGGVFTIALYSFSANSADLFRNAMRQYFESGDTKLILDLRGNPGGYLEQAVTMASYFLPVGETVVTEDTQGHGQGTVHRSLGYNVFAGKKLSMVVLVDRGSASASEILAGALQQHGVATLVGTRTFGKGSVQELVDLGGGAELKVTVARWLTPNGTSISDGGLTPDLNATTTAQDVEKGLDPTRDAAAAWLATQ